MSDKFFKSPCQIGFKGQSNTAYYKIKQYNFQEIKEWFSNPNILLNFVGLNYADLNSVEVSV